jgi:LysM repeat protein
MRKIILIVGLVFLMQLAWASTSLAAPPESGGFWHTVRRGETLFSIGRLYGVNPFTLCNANRLSNCNVIRAGQVLWVPATTTPPACSAFHRVARGQTLHGIGRLYGVSPWAIAAANKIYDLNRIYVGQTLCIPG